MLANTGVSQLDLSKLSKLETLACSNNQLTSLDLSKLSELKSLSSANNQLTSLDLSGCPKLKNVNVSENPLTEIWLNVNQDSNFTSFKYPGDAQLKFKVAIPDENLKTCLLATFDTDSDGSISADEANVPSSSIDCSGRGIKSLSGLEYFKNLKTLDCSDNQLTSIDLSENDMLHDLDCSGNAIASLDVSCLPGLSYLNCQGNALTTLDVSENSHLATLVCTGNPSLATVLLDENQTEVNITYDPAVTTLRYRRYLNGHEYVEMGDGLKWAVMNIGASNPQQIGSFYAWGEVTTKENYWYSSYKWVVEGRENDWPRYINKYQIDDGEKYYNSVGTYWYDLNGNFSGDGKSVLEAEDDVAAVTWGGSWRMPTAVEWGKLLDTDNYTWEWKNDYNGMMGMLVTSKVAGYVGNSIFLPATGIYSGNTYETSERLYYWSSSLSDETYHAQHLYGTSGGRNMDENYRYLGLAVRAVSE